ncbi:hypothetical protein K2X05_14660 [bacterium]|nr:hypothetical protein [bacterium]
MHIYKIGLFLAAGLLSFATSYAGQIKFKFQEASNGVIQFRLLGSNLCDYGKATSFTMTKGYVGQGSQFVRESQYVSKSGNDTWAVSKSCTINQQLTNDLLQPGKALKVETYGDNGALERFYIQIPCEKEFGTYAEEYLFSTDITQVSATVCDSAGSDVAVVKDVEKDTVTIPTQPVIVTEQPKNQYCSSIVSVDEMNRSLINVKLGCTYKDRLHVMILANGNLVYEQFVNITNSTYNKQLITQLRGRNFIKRAEFEVRMESTKYGTSRVDKQSVEKDPTFFSRVSQTMNTPLFVKPVAQEKSLGRGFYFETSIEVFVKDMDIDKSHPESQILVQLINTTNGQFTVINERRVSTEENVSFQLDGQYVVPLVFGSAYWDTDYVLQSGKNTFKVRVFDAYQNEKFLDSEEISIQLPRY